MIRLSVIIPTQNRAALLDKTLASILAQHFPADAFEVIVVDNASTDKTRSVTEKFSASHANVRYLHEQEPGLHSGRHAGLRAAKAPILVYADDDIEAFPGWLASIDESFQDASVGLVGGKDLPRYESPPPAWMSELWEKTDDGEYLPYFSLLDFGDDVKEIAAHFVFGCNFSIRKDIVLKAGGFHPDGFPETMMKYRGDGETFVAQSVTSMGFKIVYHPGASIYHWVPASRMTMDYVQKWWFRLGITQSFADVRESHNSARKEGVFSGIVRKLRRQKHLLTSAPLKKPWLKSYYQGYDYHQAELAKDTGLLQWVLKENYLS